MSPSQRAIAALAVWGIVSLVASFWPPARPLWWGAGGLLAGLFVIDAARLWRAGAFDVERDVQTALSVASWSTVSLRVHHRGRRAVRVEVADHPPASMRVSGLSFSTRIEAGGFVEHVYRIFPEGRGRQDFEAVELRVQSPLGLWRRRVRAGGPSAVRVFPNFREVARYSLLAVDHRTRLLGIRQRPRRGEGLDFHQLREYRAGDTLRHIDWKVTARLQKTISREYQDERDQQILFLLDCGRKMHSRDDAISHFDHALNSVLLLGHVALRRGDAVGLMTFSGAERWLAPRKGAKQLNAIMGAVYDLETSTRASDYLRAAQDLLGRVRKRALVIIVSNLRDEDHEELALAGRLLSRSHLVLVASMKERTLAAALAGEVRTLDDALRVAATHQYLASRRLAHDRLRHGGVMALDAEPDALAVALVNGYLDIKRSGLL